MTARKNRREYYTLHWERPDGSLDAMTVPTDVAWSCARAIAAETLNQNVTLIGTAGSAKVFKDGGAYVHLKGVDGQIIGKDTTSAL